MSASHSSSLRSSAAPVTPIAVSPADAGRLLSLGGSRIYALMRSGELESYVDGRARRVTVASISAYVARRVADSGGWRTWAYNPRRRKGGLLGNREAAGISTIGNE
jgi:hypothetical protein